MRPRYKLFALLAFVGTVSMACGDQPAAPASVAQTATAFGSALARGVAATLTAVPSPTRGTSTTVILSPVVMPTRPATVTTPPTPTSLLVSPTTAPMASGSAAAGATRTTPAGTGRIVTVTADESVNMRGTPSTTADVLGFIPPNEDAVVLEENVMSPDGGMPWFKVTYAGITGFVRSDLVGMARAGTPRAGSSGATAPSGTTGTTTTGTAAATAAGTTAAVATPTRMPGTVAATPTR